MASSGADNIHMTGIESSIAIEELDESLIDEDWKCQEPET